MKGCRIFNVFGVSLSNVIHIGWAATIGVAERIDDARYLDMGIAERQFAQNLPTGFLSPIDLDPLGIAARSCGVG